MNELGTTHIESLDAEKVFIPGLDVESDLKKTIILGQKKLKSKRLTNFALTSAAVLALVIGAAGLNSIISDRSQIGDDVIRTAQKSFEKVATDEVEANKAQDPQADNTVKDSPPVTIPNPITPELITIRSFGDPGLCNLGSTNPDPGPGGVVIGPSTSIQTWNPSIGQTRVETVPSSGRQLVLKNTSSNKATNGAFIDLNSGFDQSSSFANVTTLGMTYCEAGYKLEISPLTSSGYSISRTSL